MERKAFRQLAIAEFESVYRMAMHLSRHPDQAADLAQETYLRAFQAEQSFQLQDKGVKPWLFRILHNAFYTKIGKQRREPTLMEDLDSEIVAQDLESSSVTMDIGTLDWDQIDDRLKHAIEQLPAHYREVLLLWAVEGLKYREIAEVIDVALGTVMSRLYRARTILSDKLVGYAAENRIQIGSD